MKPQSLYHRMRAFSIAGFSITFLAMSANGTEERKEEVAKVSKNQAAKELAKSGSNPVSTIGTAEHQEDEDIRLPENFLHSFTIVSKSNCQIKCIAPHAESEESAKVIKTVIDMYKAYSEQDLQSLSQYLDKDCTTFDEGTKKLIIGREAVLNEIKDWLKSNAADPKNILLSYTIERPYCQVSDDTAVVTFTAIKQLGGLPRRFESRCTDIFRKDGDKWIRTHYRSHWVELQN